MGYAGQRMGFAGTRREWLGESLAPGPMLVYASGVFSKWWISFGWYFKANQKETLHFGGFYFDKTPM